MKMTDKRPLDEAQLDALFFAAAQDRPTPSDDLMARIMADAEAEIAAASIPAAVTSAPRQGWLASVIATIGGWPAAAGLATAAVTGLMIGLVPPDSLLELADDYLVASSVYELDDFMPSYGDLLGEG